MVDVLLLEMESEVPDSIDVLDRIIEIVKTVRAQFNVEGLVYDEAVLTYPSKIKVSIRVVTKEEEEEGKE